MATADFDVTGIGNAIVDSLGHADDAFLEANGLTKGAMTLIDAARADTLYEKMEPVLEVSSGSAGNTMAAIASLGGRGAYIGKIREDRFGRMFRDDIRAVGTRFETPPAVGGPPTARCLILVTPDAQRTMNTYLGACVDLGPDDIDPKVIAGSEVTYLEGYLWDQPHAKRAFLKAARLAHEAGRKVALSLSDSFCVDRHRDSFLALVTGHVDILFANEQEIMALYRVDRFEDAVAAVRAHCAVAALTRGARGSIVLADGAVHEVPAEPVARLVDTTGAGDLYAAGFLYGLTHGHPPPRCGRIGSIAAAEVLGRFGARPDTDLGALVRAKLG